jgi:hypothetical protein
MTGALFTFASIMGFGLYGRWAIKHMLANPPRYEGDDR